MQKKDLPKSFFIKIKSPEEWKKVIDFLEEKNFLYCPSLWIKETSVFPFFLIAKNKNIFIDETSPDIFEELFLKDFTEDKPENENQIKTEENNQLLVALKRLHDFAIYELGKNIKDIEEIENLIRKHS